MNNSDIGIAAPKVLLPNSQVDLSKWAVVACDQFTSQPEYWRRLENEVGGDPSSLNLIFPEVYLNDEDAEDRVRGINRTMEDYLERNVLVEADSGFILVERRTSHVESRKGLVVALDLEKYDYKPGSQSLIRATEGTIEDRLPPRIKIRENAPIELPHIMALIDDPDCSVIEPLFERDLAPVYDFPLNSGGGHLRGWRVDSESDIEGIFAALEKLSDQAIFDAKYSVSGKGVLLYAMGDGNHSLATAKSIWERLKSEADDLEAIMSHPARFALVELMNVHDEGLEFEPIHRVVFDVDAKQVLSGIQAHFEGEGSTAAIERYDCLVEAEKRLGSLDTEDGEHRILYVSEGESGLVRIRNPKRNLEVGSLQAFIDSFLGENGGDVDYIHGEDVLVELGSKAGNVGFLLPGIGKSDLFKTVVLDGALPRKTFSMGEADEKRYYLEARRIR